MKGHSAMQHDRKFIVDILFVLTLFAMFTISSLLLVMIGATVYQNNVETMSDNFDTRTSLSYITEKIRQNDIISMSDITASSISIDDLAGCQSLKITQTINDEKYCTYLYFYNGYLKELFVKEDRFLGDTVLDAGQNIINIQDFSIEAIDTNLFRVKVTNNNGDLDQVIISTRCNNN